MIMLSIMETFNEWGSKFKHFVVENNRNPIFWVCVFVAGLLLFFWTYNALTKNHQQELK